MFGKKTVLLVVVLTTICLCAFFGAFSDAATLVARYEFEDGLDMGSDISGLGNDADTVLNISQTGGHIAGRDAGAFGGTHQLKINSLTGYDGLPGFTLAAWVKLDNDTTGYDGIIAQDTGGCCETRFMLNGDQHPFINVHQHSDRTLGLVTVPKGSWFHYALTAESDGTARVYIDGAEVAGSPQAFAALGSSASFATYLGHGDGGTGHPMKGALDDVRIYDGALTGADIMALTGTVLLQTPTAEYHQNFSNGVDGTIDGDTSGGNGMAFIDHHTTTTDIVWETQSDVITPGELTFELQMNLGVGHTLQRFRLSATDADRSLFADGNPPPPPATSPPGDVDPSPGSWTVLTPTSLVSAGGATMTVDGSGIITVSGANPATDIYTITADHSLASVTGLRLEVIPGPDGFVGRSAGAPHGSNGNAVLTEFSVDYVPIPEPGTLLLAVMGLAGLAAFRWRRKSRVRSGE